MIGGCSAPEFLLLRRLWDGRWPGSETLFCPLSMAMDLDDGGVDHGVFHVWRIRAGLENPGEDVCFNPVAVTLENSVPVAEGRRRSRHGLPVRAIQSTASTKRRLSLPLRPGSVGFRRQCGSIFAHWASLSTNRLLRGRFHSIAFGSLA
jgi:hypothetical protein